MIKSSKYLVGSGRVKVMRRVAFVGHSQVPHYLRVEGADVKIFRKPGGLLFSLETTPQMWKFTDEFWDIVVLWIGSNDVDLKVKANVITDELVRITNFVAEKCNAVVQLVGIEPRRYPDLYPIISHVEYRRCAKAVTKKLKRLLPYNRVLDLLGYPSECLDHDGVHFTLEGKLWIENKIRENIVRQIEEWAEAGLE